MGPSLVVIVPVQMFLGQKACLIEPHGSLGFVPKYVFPSVPTWKPGAILVTVMLTIDASLVADLIVYEFPSSESSRATSFA